MGRPHRQHEGWRTLYPRPGRALALEERRFHRDGVGHAVHVPEVIAQHELALGFVVLVERDPKDALSLAAEPSSVTLFSCIVDRVIGIAESVGDQPLGLSLKIGKMVLILGRRHIKGVGLPPLH